MKKACLFLFIIIFVTLGVASDIDSLLDELAQKDDLSKDKTTTNMFTQISNDTSSFEFQVVDGDFDQFAGGSWNMTPVTDKGNFTYLSTSFSSMFQDESLKLFLHYAYIDADSKETASSPLGVVPNGGIEDENTIGARLGHIYTSNSIMQKTFLMSREFTPSTHIRLYYDMGLLGTNGLKKRDSILFGNRVFMVIQQC